IGDRIEERRLVLRVTRQLPRLDRRRYRLDGPRLGRWCFKVTINLVASGNIQNFPDDWEPRQSLVRFVFGEGSLPDGCGLGQVAVVGEKVENPDYFSFDLIRRIEPSEQPPDAEGFLITFRGLRLAGSSTHPLASLHTALDPDNPEQVLLHP